MRGELEVSIEPLGLRVNIYEKTGPRASTEIEDPTDDIKGWSGLAFLDALAFDLSKIV